MPKTVAFRNMVIVKYLHLNEWVIVHMHLAVYIEINLISIILSCIVYSKFHQNLTIKSTSQAIMRKLIFALWVLCIADIVAISCRGQFFSGAKAVIEISNLVYVEMMPLISLLWLLYTCAKLKINVSRTKSIIIAIPFIALTIIAASNPFHHYLFLINEENLYVRGDGIFLHWIGSWIYLIAASILSARASYNAPNYSKRHEYLPLLFFLILPAIGCVAQMLFYGITSVQVGITLSLVLLSVQMQNNQISLDELTGINNRRALQRYIDNTIHRINPPMLTVMMIDINRFKRINDTFGHSVGDDALCDLADILKRVCGKMDMGLVLSRYGGDEFVIVGKNISDDDILKITDMIREDTERFSQNGRPYELSVSIGYSTGSCAKYDDFAQCLREADAAMYRDKRRIKAMADKKDTP